MSDAVITKLTLQEELNESGIKCAEFAHSGNKMQCPKKPEYRRVTKTFKNGKAVDKVDFLCQGHYQLLTVAKNKVSH